jgi:hypothetical protein
MVSTKLAGSLTKAVERVGVAVGEFEQLLRIEHASTTANAAPTVARLIWHLPRPSE